MSFRRYITLAALMLATAPATWAQPAAAAGMGTAAASAPAAMGQARVARWGQDYTPGWMLMSEAERNEHREQMQRMKTYDACKAYLDQHHARMAVRVAERKITPPGHPGNDACAPLKP